MSLTRNELSVVHRKTQVSMTRWSHRRWMYWEKTGKKIPKLGWLLLFYRSALTGALHVTKDLHFLKNASLFKPKLHSQGEGIQKWLQPWLKSELHEYIFLFKFCFWGSTPCFPKQNLWRWSQGPWRISDSFKTSWFMNSWIEIKKIFFSEAVSFIYNQISFLYLSNIVFKLWINQIYTNGYNDNSIQKKKLTVAL